MEKQSNSDGKISRHWIVDILLLIHWNIIQIWIINESDQKCFILNITLCSKFLNCMNQIFKILSIKVLLNWKRLKFLNKYGEYWIYFMVARNFDVGHFALFWYSWFVALLTFISSIETINLRLIVIPNEKEKAP